ncbi:hypothetical protein QRQ56_20935 [Bradyrhizobium sp. U531]|uniref:hypothetical protein n=1 Tax=Bradyrhizobium sp. U531 TaxID=3053458 RepID=UPI003F42F1CF
MRVAIPAISLSVLLACVGRVEALDCPVPSPSMWSRVADSDEIPIEQQRREAKDRTDVYRLDSVPIIFRGRVVSVRYLSDIRKTNIPLSLLVFDRVQILKGQLFTRSKDRRAVVIRQEWCDQSCIGKLSSSAWSAGKIVAVAAYRNDFADPSRTIEFSSKRILYRGRIDAVLGECSAGLLSNRQLELLNDPDEMNRLKREYVPLRTN